MATCRFEDLEVWKLARSITGEIYGITYMAAFSKDYGLANQIRRASISIMSNIAEGYERGSNKEFIQFLYIAKGSCGELRSQLFVALDQKYISDKRFGKISNSAKKLSIMLNHFIDYLKGSGYKGFKFKQSPR